MKLPNVKGLVGVVKTFAMANRPEILLATSLTATLGGVVLAAKGGYEARGIIDDEVLRRQLDATSGIHFDNYLEYEAARDGYAPLDLKEKVQLTWLCYVPAALATTTAVGSIGGLHLVHVKEKKALATAALAAIEEIRSEAKQYTDGILETVEENTTPKAQEKIQAALDEKGPPPSYMIDADQLYVVKDAYTGRTFYGTENKIQNSINEVNSLLNNRDVELNSFYVWAGVPEIQDGDEYGWNTRDFITIKWEDVHLDDGRPVRQFTFNPKPRKGYDSGV